MKLTEAQEQEFKDCIDLFVKTMFDTQTYKLSPSIELIVVAQQMAQLNFYYNHPELMISDKEIVKEARA